MPLPLLMPAITADLDQDGLRETIRARFDKRAHLMVEVREQGRRDVLDLGMFVDINGPRTDLEVSIVPADEAGVGLLKLYVPAGEYCGSGNDWVYVSFVNDDLQKALQVGDFFDAPVWSSVETRFDPKRLTVRVEQSYGEEDRTNGRHVEKLRFEEGVYK